MIGGGVLFPVKVYDLAALAIAYAVLARQPPALQIACAGPMLVIWRPGLAGLAGVSAEGQLTLVTLCAIGVATGLLGAALGRRARRRARTAPLAGG